MPDLPRGACFQSEPMIFFFPFLDASPARRFTSGFGSNESMWLHPPVKKTMITRLAFGWKCGCFDASGCSNTASPDGAASNGAICVANEKPAHALLVFAEFFKKRLRVSDRFFIVITIIECK
jgi:hypothetical protein